MIGKIVVSAISVFLVVGVVIGIVSVTHSHGKGNQDASNPGLSASVKSVAAICSATDYKDACMQSLSPVAKNASATPNDYVQAAMQATINEIKTSMNFSADLSHTAKDSRTQMALDDCKELLGFAIDELRETLSSFAGTHNAAEVQNRTADVMSWLSAVVAYQETCLDGFVNEEFKASMQKGLTNATQLSSNALAIAAEFTQILAVFGGVAAAAAATVPKPSSRRLMEAEAGLRSNGYPEWFSAADRKLLATGVNSGRLRPNAVVAQDGSGQFRTIGAALDAYPKGLRGRYVIYVKAGIYKENIIVTKEKVNVYMYGDGPRKTIVTGKKSFLDGITTYKTATFSAIGRGFVARSMGFDNSAGPNGHQAVALRVQSDMSAFFNCRMTGYQDTLYVQAQRQFYRNCVISGTIDFIFGDSTCVIQNSLIIVRRPNENQQNTVTAHGKKEARETTGLVIQNCRILPEQKLFRDRFRIPTYLGRPWKEYSKTVVMESMLGDLIQPAGWMPWAGDFALNTLTYREYANTGPGANTRNRVQWRGFKVIRNRREALQFTVNSFIQGHTWLKQTFIPYLPTLKR